MKQLALQEKFLFVLLMAGMTVSVQEVRGQQNEATARFRLAQSYEQEGEWERALPLYESLYQSDPRNYVYFDGLRRTYTQLKQYDKALVLVRERLTMQPNDPMLRAMIGTLHYQSGQEAAADSAWNSVVQSDTKNVNLYRVVASQMIENRLYDQAVQLYLRARVETGNGRIFAEELSWLYGSFQQYAQATKELVTMLRGTPAQLPSVQSRLGSFTAREEGIKQALLVVRDEVNKNPKDVSLRTLLAWVYMEKKDFDAALGEYRVIDKQRNANGQELFTFAQRALQERAYKAAATAFREVINEYPARERLPFARLGYARAIEELSAVADTSSALSGEPAMFETLKNSAQVSEIQPSYQGALTLYDAIIKDYAGTEFAAQTYFRVGVIRRTRFFDLDGALEAFDRVRKITQTVGLVFESTMNIGEVLTAKNDLERARAEYQRLMQLSSAELRDRAVFRLAELDYFEAQFDSALTKIQPLASNITTDLANDALQLQYFIQENKTSAASALAAFAKADLLIRQNKYSEALRQFKEIIKLYPTALLLDDAVMRTGELHLRLKQVDESLAAFKSVAQEMPASIYRDAAQMRIAEIYETVVRDTVKAIEAYQMVLSKYPNSLHAEEARKRIRLLRGDAI